MLAHCKIVDVSVCASQAAARKAQPLWQQLGFQAKIYERKKISMLNGIDFAFLVFFISTEGALRRPTTYDDHPIQSDPHIAMKTTSHN